jgi:SAM-dependent methyltransferase
VLPPEHAAALTRASGPDNLAELAQLVSTLGNVEDRIVDVFRRGGGVGYDAYERFHDWMSEASRTTLEATLLTRVLPQVPGLTPRLESGIDVLDVGCGLGDAVIGGGNISRPTHCTTVSLAVGGEGLGACWGVEKAREYLSAAGFASVDTFTVDGDPFNVYFRCAP